MNVAMMLKTDESAIAEIRISALLMVNVSQATLSTKLQSRQLPCSDTKTYIGMTENDFKTRYNNHKLSFKERKHSQDTVLSKHIWHVRPSVRPSVRPPAPQDHQYEVAHTWDNPVLYPAFLARNRMVTRIWAKTTKVKDNFINGKEKFKRILSCLFGGRRKVQVTNLPSRTSSLLSVLLRTRSSQRLSSHHFAGVPTPNIAELVPSSFSVHNHGFCGVLNTFSQVEPQHFRVDRHLFTGEERSRKINFFSCVSVRGRLKSRRSATSACGVRFSARTCFFFFNLTTSLRAFLQINKFQQKTNVELRFLAWLNQVNSLQIICKSLQIFWGFHVFAILHSILENFWNVDTPFKISSPRITTPAYTRVGIVRVYPRRRRRPIYVNEIFMLRVTFVMWCFVFSSGALISKQ